MVKQEHFNYTSFYHGEWKDWHKSHSEAVKRAEEMRVKKLKSLDKQMRKISEMVFDL